MKRVTLFCGHYGSGKTNLAVNYALDLRQKGLEVSLADLDIVNPYFRSKDSEAQLEAAGVRVIALPFANSAGKILKYRMKEESEKQLGLV